MGVYCNRCKKHDALVVVERRQAGHGDFVNVAHVECPCGAKGEEVDDYFNPRFKKDAKAKFKAQRGDE